MKYLFKLFLYLCLTIKLIYSNIYNEYFGDPIVYLHEVCSYNGQPMYNGRTRKITCICEEKYANEPREKYKKYINGNLVQCSYERKKRFLVLFLAAICPLGIDYYYLGHYYIFALTLGYSIVIITFNIISSVLNYEINKKNEEIKLRKKFKKANKGFDLSNLTEINSKCVNSFIIATRILTAILIIFWIHNIIMQGTGIIKDSNDVSTENDIFYLFEKPEF